MTRTAVLCAAASFAIALSACTTPAPTVRVEGWSSMSRSEGGAPPSTAVHGHVHRIEDARYGALQLVYDEALGAYTVIELPGHYHLDGMYVRLEDGSWSEASTLGGDWQPRAADTLPAPLSREGQYPARTAGDR